jgi:hypothetical protein
MNRKRWGKVTGITVVGIVMIGVLKACVPVTSVATAPRPIVEGVIGVSSISREAQGGGFVTVYFGMVPGPLPDTSMTGPPTTVAWFSNVGEGGKHERRYDWKPSSQAQYELVLSTDSSGGPRWTRWTRWTMNEINATTRVRTPFRTGRLWACDTEPHSYTARAVRFKDCTRRVQYDPRELSLHTTGNQLPTFASYIEGGETEIDEANGPGWISCTSGCCTLGAAY